MQNILHKTIWLINIYMTKKKLFTHYNSICKSCFLYKVIEFKYITLFMYTIFDCILLAFLFKFLNAAVNSFNICVCKSKYRFRCKFNSCRGYHIKIGGVKKGSG